MVPLGVAASFWALKGILVVASLATILLVWRCARLLGRDPLAAIALVGLNPIVLVWGLGGDHNDFLMMFFIVLGFYLLLLARARARDAPGEAGAAGRAGAAGKAGAAGGTSSSGLRGWLLPLAALEIGAGAAFVTATAIKASGGVLIPVVLAGLLRTPRALIQVVLGMVVAGVVVGAASLLAFGLHIPDLSTQGSLVTNESVPNLIGLAAGAGGESTGLREAPQRCPGRVGAPVLLAGVERGVWPMLRRSVDHGVRLGERGPAGDPQLGSALVRAVGAAAGRAVELAQAANGCARARCVPDRRLGARVSGCCGTPSTSIRKRRRSAGCTSATSRSC